MGTSRSDFLEWFVVGGAPRRVRARISSLNGPAGQEVGTGPRACPQVARRTQAPSPNELGWDLTRTWTWVAGPGESGPVR